MRFRFSIPALVTVVAVAACGGGSGESPQAALQITTQPVSQTVQLGSAFSLKVVAEGDKALAYQWFRNGVALLRDTASSTLSVSTAAVSDGGNYTVTVSDSAGHTATSTQAAITIGNSGADHSAGASADRVVVGPRQGTNFKLPSAEKDWIIKYQFIVPPLPGKTWDPSSHVFYVWGDIDFDQYGANGNFPLSGYKYNQIVPQAFIGNVLSGNDANYNPSWSSLSAWAIQSQYFWQKGDVPYALTGPMVNVSPGQLVTTTIQYTASSGAIAATIAAANGTSTITIARPFPNEPALYASWTDFFKKAQVKTGTDYVWSQPVMNIEPHGLDKQTLCTVLPLDVRSISLPGLGASSSSYAFKLASGLPCSASPVVFNF